MADSDDLGSFIAAIFMVVLIIIVAIAAILLFGSIGALFGSSISIRNYYKSFSKNVSLEKPAI